MKAQYKADSGLLFLFNNIEICHIEIIINALHADEA